MEGIIANFRMSGKRKSNNQMVVQVKGVDSREKAAKLAGKKAVWKTPTGKEIKGEVRSAHGNSGALRVLLRTAFCPRLPRHERLLHPARPSADHPRQTPATWRRASHCR